ncbi:hypothetical protein [Aquimarina algiphila]|uniref:hypothetical protein n=1 Tax=Aquimarina algiphila TaxID=2047982 RepID=UPI00232D096A|nr:hypothetical protein [Aquimarina algiphila]
MRLKKIKTLKGCKIYHNGNHVKTVPAKYSNVITLKHIINPIKKRLTAEERFRLEISLFEFTLSCEEKYVYDLIKRSIPQAVQKVVNYEGVIRFVLIYKNSKRIRISKSLYDLCSNKLEVKYSNY